MCRLLAAMPEPQPHAAPRAAVLDLERAGAALSVSSADAPALEQGVCHVLESRWLRCDAEMCNQGKAHQPRP